VAFLRPGTLPVTADSALALFNGLNAVFMSFQPYESGIQALRSGAGEASVMKARFRCTPKPTARRVRTTITIS
jgi:hypothetical protein